VPRQPCPHGRGHQLSVKALIRLEIGLGCKQSIGYILKLDFPGGSISDVYDIIVIFYVM
jgi:hypothetical protein